MELSLLLSALFTISQMALDGSFVIWSPEGCPTSLYYTYVFDERTAGYRVTFELGLGSS